MIDHNFHYLGRDTLLANDHLHLLSQVLIMISALLGSLFSHWEPRISESLLCLDTSSPSVFIPTFFVIVMLTEFRLSLGAHILILPNCNHTHTPSYKLVSAEDIYTES